MTRPPRQGKGTGSEKSDKGGWPVVGMGELKAPPSTISLIAQSRVRRHYMRPSERKAEEAAKHRHALWKARKADEMRVLEETFGKATVQALLERTKEAAVEAVRAHESAIASNGPSERRKLLAEKRAGWIEEFGLRVKAERERQGFTQGAFAKAVGMPQSHLSQLENGKLEARLSTLYTFSSVLNVRPGILLAGA